VGIPAQLAQGRRFGAAPRIAWARRLRQIAVVLSICASCLHSALAQTDVSQLKSDHGSLQPVQIPSHETLLNGFVYVAAGEGPHPVVILLHGFPGYERNLDIAQDIRRNGWDVLYFDYRGSWGSPGVFTFSHCIEDAAAAIAYVRRPFVAKHLRADSSRIVLVGHSMGGFVAIEAASGDPGIEAVALISAVDLGGLVPQPLPESTDALVKGLSKGYASEGLAPLSGCTPEGLAHETIINARQWTFVTKASALSSRPLLIVTTEDGFAPASDRLAAALRAAGDRHAVTLHLATDHPYSDGGEVARYRGRHGAKRVAKAVLMSAVPPLMLKTDKNPGGLPLSVFDDLRAALRPTGHSSKTEPGVIQRADYQEAKSASECPTTNNELIFERSFECLLQINHFTSIFR
jgi:uncharacterized protein